MLGKTRKLLLARTFDHSLASSSPSRGPNPRVPVDSKNRTPVQKLVNPVLESNSAAKSRLQLQLEGLRGRA